MATQAPTARDFSVPEQAFLLLLDDSGGTEAWASEMVGLATLVELALHDRVSLDGINVCAKSRRPMGREPADTLLAALKDTTPSGELRRVMLESRVRMGKSFDDLVAESMVARGVCRKEQRTRLFIFTSTYYPLVNLKPRYDTQNALRAVVHGGEDDPGLASLIGILTYFGAARRLPFSAVEMETAISRLKQLAKTFPVVTGAMTTAKLVRESMISTSSDVGGGCGGCGGG